MSQLERKKTLGIKIEAVEGVAETIVAADIILVDNIQFTGDTPALETNHLSSTLSKSAGVPGRSIGSISFDVLMYGASGSGVAPYWGDLLLACGMSETIVASTSAEYLPASSGIKTLTIKSFMDGISHVLRGCRGSWTLAGAVGEFVVYSFSFQGVWEPETDADSNKDEALLEGTSFPSFLPDKFQNANLTIAGSYLAVFESLSLDIGNTLANVPDGNVSNYKRVDLTDREPKGEISVESITRATYDFYDVVARKTQVAIEAFVGANENGTGTGSPNTMTDSAKNWPLDIWNTSYSLRDSAGAVFAITDTTSITLTVSGTPASGNYVIFKPGKLTIISVPKAELQSQSNGATDGRMVQGIPFMCKKNAAAGNDEISIKVI